MAQSPAGVQVYLLTSFIFTLFQGAALRNNTFRGAVGLPLRGAPPPEGRFVNEFILFNKLERDTKGVLSPKYQSSFKPFAEMLSPSEMKRMEEEAKEEKTKMSSFDGVGVFAAEYQPAFQPSPVYLIVNQIADNVQRGIKREKNKNNQNVISSELITEIAPSMDDVMDAANRGEKPAAPIQITSNKKGSEAISGSPTLNVQKLASKAKRKVGAKNIAKRKR